MTHACAQCTAPIIDRPAAWIRRSQRRGGRMFCNRECFALWKASIPVEDRFWPKVNKDAPNGCWLWTGAVSKHDGYARFLYQGHVKHAHRVAMILSGFDVPADMDVDHCVCRIRHCVNPAHLRVATQRQNALENNDSPFARNKRKTYCVRGHPLSGDNILIYEGVSERGSKTINRKCLACYGPGGSARRKQS